MGLYLCIFDGDEDVDGVEVGAYAEYNALRDDIVRELEVGRVGSCFPTFVLHSDCNGEWSVTHCQRLQDELAEIAAALNNPRRLRSLPTGKRTWQNPLGLNRKMPLNLPLMWTASFWLNACRGCS